MSEPKLQGKTQDIPKHLVWDAWLKVKRNGGAAGADGVTIEQFEERLKDRLYRLWNRMSSGSYFATAISLDRSERWRYPRKVGPGSSEYPTWSTGWRNRWRWRCWSPTWRKFSTTTLTATVRDAPRWTR